MDVHANVHTLSTQSKLEIKISLCACAWDTSDDSEEERPAEALDLIVLTLFLCSRAKKQQKKKQVQNLYVLQTFEYMKPVASVFAAPAVQLISLMWTFLIRSYLYYSFVCCVRHVFCLPLAVCRAGWPQGWWGDDRCPPASSCDQKVCGFYWENAPQMPAQRKMQRREGTSSS